MTRQRSVRVVVLGTVFALISSALSGWAPNRASAAGCGLGVPGDINGDGHADVAVSEPRRRGGTVHVLYGQAGGLVVDASGTAPDDQVFSQDTAGVPGVGEEDDDFGIRSVLADFNGDGCADLAAATPGENGYTGRVVVLYGTPRGLSTTGAQSFTAASVFGAGIGASLFGFELADGDFNDDEVRDLAIGVPSEAKTGRTLGGAVAVLYGARTGVNRGQKAVLLSQASPGVPGTAGVEDGFGGALAAGDFDGLGVDDLAVGAPGKSNGSGVVTVLPGAAGRGVGVVPGASLSQDTTGVPGKAEHNDAFASVLAAGDVTGDGRADLAVGVPFENGRRDGDGYEGEGAVSFLPGSATGLTGQGSQIWTQGSPGVGGATGRNDQFGWALAIAPLDVGPHADLAIGAPPDSVGSVGYAGSVTLLLGTPSGLSTKGAGGRRLTQDTPGVNGVPEPIDFFGAALAAPRIQSRTQASLVIGAFGETIGNDEMAGVVHQLSISDSGPSGTASRTFHLRSPGVKGDPSVSFGYDVS